MQLVERGVGTRHSMRDLRHNWKSGPKKRIDLPQRKYELMMRKVNSKPWAGRRWRVWLGAMEWTMKSYYSFIGGRV